VCGRLIPKGAIVWVVPWVLHRNPILWENPGRFDPARFSEERSSGRSRFAYLPFSTGPGVCIGATLAMTEALLILTTVFSLPSPKPIGCVLSVKSHPTLTPPV
jgi:cytochrome P450